jgi:hypothetical protein
MLIGVASLAKGDNLLHSLGHVDPATKRPVTAIVFPVPQQAYYQVLCQACAWRQVRPPFSWQPPVAVDTSASSPGFTRT